MKDLTEDVMEKALEGGNYPKHILIEDLGRMFPTKDSKQKTRFGVYKCGFCGTNFKAITYDVNRGCVKSCGCYKKRITGELNKTHGLRNTRLYNTWSRLKDRVLNPKNKNYIDYGGRGISICDEWKNDFMSFYNWAMENGYSDGLSLDRIDNDGNYETSNCRWTTQTIQTRNKRIPKNNSSGYKGVCLIKKTNKYMSYITVDKNKVYLGIFPTVVEAGKAYNNYIIENNLEGFILNEIPKEYKND